VTAHLGQVQICDWLALPAKGSAYAPAQPPAQTLLNTVILAILWFQDPNDWLAHPKLKVQARQLKPSHCYCFLCPPDSCLTVGLCKHQCQVWKLFHWFFAHNPKRLCQSFAPLNSHATCCRIL
jgi:hypothetical protein